MYYIFVLEFLERIIYGYNFIRYVIVKFFINVILYFFNLSVIV